MIVDLPIEKQPAEVVPFSVDFGFILAPTEAITSSAFKAYTFAGTDATSTLAEGTIAVDGTVYTQMIKGGVGIPPTTYLLELEAITNLGQKRQAERKLEVKTVPQPQPQPPSEGLVFTRTGIVAVTPGDTLVIVTGIFPTPPYVALVTPNWMTTVAVRPDSQTTSQFIVDLGTPAAAGAALGWAVV